MSQIQAHGKLVLIICDAIAHFAGRHVIYFTITRLTMYVGCKKKISEFTDC